MKIQQAHVLDQEWENVYGVRDRPCAVDAIGGGAAA